MIGKASPKAAWAFAGGWELATCNELAEGRVLATEKTDPVRETRANEPGTGFFCHVFFYEMLRQFRVMQTSAMCRAVLPIGKIGIGIASGKLNPGSAKTLASATPRIRAPKCKGRGAPPQ